MKNLITKVAILWAIIAFINLFIIKGTSIGPVILTISTTHGWGVHTFDLIVFPITLIAMAVSAVMFVNFKKTNA